MASPIIKINGRLIPRSSIAYVEELDTVSCAVSLVTVDGTLHKRYYDTLAEARAKYDLIRNLTEIDDLDGI